MTAQIIQLKKFKKVDEEYHNLFDKLNYYKESLDKYEKSIKSDGDNILAGMSNIFGSHNKETKNKFLSFLNNPSPETWSNIRNYLIDSTTTSWQLWTRFDKNAPRGLIGSDSLLHPTKDDFIDFFNKHKKQRIESFKNIISEIEIELKKYKT